MAKPFVPKFVPHLAEESLHDVHDQGAKKGAAHDQDSPPDQSPPAKPLSKPWPTTESPLARTDGEPSIAPAPTDDWEEPAAFPASPNGAYFGQGDLSFSETNVNPGAPMAKPAGYDWEETAQTREQEGEMDSAEGSPLFLSRRPLYKRSEAPPTTDEQLENVIEFLQKLQRSVRTITPEAEAPSPTALGSSLLQLRRLSRTGVVPDHFEIGVLPRPPRVEVAPPVAEAIPEVDAPKTVEPKKILPLSEPVRLERRHAVWLVLTGGLCLVTLGLVAYLWMQIGPFPRVNPAPRNPVARGTPGQAPSQEVSEEALNLADLALEAMQRGDLKRASDILMQAQKQNMVLPGLSYQEALLALNQGQQQAADDFLERSIKANEAVPDCWYLRANKIFFSAGPAQAAEAFAEAIAAAPFSPRHYFFRAECLRRNGQTTAAVGQFQLALRCRPNSAETELILFKIGLTKIETNSDLIFKTELHDRLAQEPVLGDTLLLAAADAIVRNEFAEAADFLKRAALSLPPRVFQSRIRDYVFQAQAKQPDIAAVLKLTLSAATPSSQPVQHPGRALIDPATRSLAEADPGGW